MLSVQVLEKLPAACKNLDFHEESNLGFDFSLEVFDLPHVGTLGPGLTIEVSHENTVHPAVGLE